MNTRNAERSGHPVEVTTSEIDKINGMVMNDRRVKVREITCAVGASARFRPEKAIRKTLRLLTIDQKPDSV